MRISRLPGVALLALAVSLGALAACDQGKPRHLPPDPFAAPPDAGVEPPREGMSAGLPRLPGRPGFFLDHIGAAADPMNKPPPPLTPGAPMLVDGFAFDAVAKAPARGVDVVIDGKAYGTSYGQPRQDVATYFKSPNLTATGFRTTLPPSAVAGGAHMAWLRVVATDGKGFYESPQTPFYVR